jgi:ppGpp synthetase/RelA/SpoT-type nucleotidyltranferase
MDDTRLRAAVESYAAQRSRYETFAQAMQSLVMRLCAAEGIEAYTVTARAKEVASLTDKIRRRRYTDIAQVIDKCGIRIVVRYRSEVDAVCELLGRELEVLETVRHGAMSPEAFGYASSHVVLCLDERRRPLAEWREFADLVAEVQVRTILQHAWASISHSLDYKSGDEVPQEVRRRLYRVAALLEASDETFEVFRGEIGALRAGYQEEVSEDTWRGLPLNLDSLGAAWSRFRWRDIEHLARECGWEASGDDAEDPTTPYALELRSVLFHVATHAGLRTLGDLAGYADRIAEHAAVIADIAVRGRSAGNPPAADPPDVLALAIIGTRRQRFLTRPEQVDRAFAPWLWVSALGEFGKVV